MKFQKGQGGRPKGVENKVTREVRELAGRLFDAEYWRTIKQQLLRGRVAPQVHVRLLAYAYGEPSKHLTVDGAVTVKDKRNVLRQLPEDVVRELVAREAFDEAGEETIN